MKMEYKKGDIINMTNWEKNANIVETVYGGFVDREEGFYLCPECEEPIYKDDWSEEELEELCPVCNFCDNSYFKD